MRLRKNILQKISDPRIRIRLCMALRVTDQTIIRYLKDNKDDLTKAAAMVIIREETGLSDSQILEEVEAEFA